MLVEGVFKEADEELFGRRTHKSVLVLATQDFKPGDYVNVKIESCASARLKGKAV